VKTKNSPSLILLLALSICCLLPVNQAFAQADSSNVSGLSPEEKEALKEALQERDRALKEAQEEIKKSTEYLDRRTQTIEGRKKEKKKKKVKKFFKRTFKDISNSVNKTSDKFGVAATIKLAKMRTKKGHYDKAIDHYEDAIDLLEDMEKEDQIKEIHVEIHRLEDLMIGKTTTTTATTSTNKPTNETIKIEPEKSRRKVEESLTSLPNRIKIPKPKVIVPKPSPPEVIIIQQDEKIAKEEKKVVSFRQRARQLEKNKNFEESLSYFKKYAELEKQVAEDKRLQELAMLERAHEIEGQDKTIALLQQNEEISKLQLAQNKTELKRQLNFKRSLMAGLGLLGATLFSVFMLYKNKQADHKKLGLAYQRLEIAQGQLKTAEQKITNLLHQQVSGAVANELLNPTVAQKKERQFVCILFLDIRNFTPFVENLSPEEIIEYQNNVLGFMIETIIKRKGIVNQILGDGFMATFGAPISSGNDCEQAYLAAREIMETVEAKSKSGEIPPTKIGIGLHAGNVVSGNVGTKDRKQFSITGNTVIIASRLEQLNKEFGTTMIISKEVFEHLSEDSKEPVEFSSVVVKGRTEPIEIAKFS